MEKQKPPEVTWAASILYDGLPHGSETHEKLDEIVSKYPEYFRWEIRYRKIPKEIHDAFHRDLGKEYDRIFGKHEIENTSIDWRGLMIQIKEMDPPEYKFSFKEDLEKWFMELYKEYDRVQINERRFENQRKRIWNKHYRPYGLKYRK